MKTVKRIDLMWTDETGQRFGVAAAIVEPTSPIAERLQDMALDRLRAIFDEWRRGL